MIIRCQTCGTQLRLEESKVGERGAKIRCTHCDNSFSVTRDTLAQFAVPGGVATKPPARSPSGRIDLELDLDPGSIAIETDGIEMSSGTGKSLDFEPAAAPMQIDDDDLVLVDDVDLLPEIAPTPGARPTIRVMPDMSTKGPSETRQPPSPAPAVARAETRPGPPPTLKTAPPAPIDEADMDTHVGPPSFLAPGEDEGIPAAAPPTPPAEEEAFDFRGGLAADGTFIAPDAEPPREAASEFGSVVTRAVKRPEAEALASIAAELSARSTQQLKVAPVLPQGSRTGWVAKLAAGLAALVLLIAGAVVFLGRGKIDARLLSLDAAAFANLLRPHDAVTLDGLKVQLIRSVRYPVGGGTWYLVFRGEVVNASSEARDGIDIVAELRDRTGRLLMSERAPIGVALAPVEIAAVSDPASLDALYRAKISARAGTSLLPGATASFTVVMLKPPAEVFGLRHSVTLVHGEPWLKSPSPIPAPPPAEELAAAALAKRKGKFLKLKSKRKARATDLEGTDPIY